MSKPKASIHAALISFFRRDAYYPGLIVHRTTTLMPRPVEE